MPVRGGLPTDLLALADEALYQAKGNGKNCTVLREMPFITDARTNA